MKGIDLLETHTWQPLARFNLTHPFFSLNQDTIICTWVVLALILMLFLPVRMIMRGKSLTRYMLLSFVQGFIDLTKQTLGTLHLNHFYFMTGLFCYIFLCNVLSIFPWLEEPTKDLNTALALGCISFFYVQIYALKTQGFREYMQEYLTPFFFMFPLNVIGKLSSLVSISFRLFGNIFGGAAITQIWASAIQGSIIWEIVGIISGVNIIVTLFFVLFEGFLQAFVFSMLTITYLSMTMHSHDDSQEAGSHG